LADIVSPSQRPAAQVCYFHCRETVLGECLVVVPLGAIKTFLELAKAEFLVPRVASAEGLKFGIRTQLRRGVDVDEIAW
jgi:hypothetical protein